MKLQVFRGEEPTISPEFGISNGEIFEETIYIETSQGFQTLVPAGVPVNPDYAKAIQDKVKTIDPAKPKKGATAAQSE